MFKAAASALALLIATPALADELPPVHCNSDQGEKTWFSGYARSLDTIISICGSPTMDGPDAWLQMRYGAYGGDVLSYPSERAGSLAAFTFARYTRPRVTYLRLGIVADGLTYMIYDGSDADDPAVSGASLTIIFPSGEETSHDLISTTETMSFGRLDDAVPNKPFLE